MHLSRIILGRNRMFVSCCRGLLNVVMGVLVSDVAIANLAGVEAIELLRDT